ncbi:hypothetical protein ACEWY4_020296 [Coilia grayii]|uniref:DH domain-containing protein n=1 Tax=Coilia grayii TaxID=363190 RepID=A0ABD1JC91_9TELE
MEPSNLRRDDWAEMPRDRDAEVDTGMDAAVSAADAQYGQWAALDKHRSNTVGPQKKQRQKVVDFGTVSKASSVNVKTRTPLIQGLFTQGSSDKTPVPEEQGALEGLKQALESYAVPADLTWKWAEGGTAHTLEDNWTELVHSHWMMSKTQRHQQEALWEFIHTELSYINKITIITDLVMAALSNLHLHGYLSEVTPEKLFSNLPSILAAHQRFWEEVMRPMLLRARQTGRPLDPLMLEPGCLQFEERLPSYFQYCLEEERAVEFTRRQMETNPYFNAFITWVETHPQCSRMRLGDMQAKPHQRITKYPLLLKAILKATEDPDTQDSLKRMLFSVNNFVDSINNHLKQRDEEQALSQCSQRIEGYDIVEGMSEEINKYVKEFHFDLMSPVRGVGPEVIRKLLLEDTIKIRGRKDSKVEAVLLLFTDVVLVAKGQRKSEKLKVVRPPLALDRMHCSALKDGYSFILVEVSDLGCAVSVYVVSTSSPENCSAWVSALENAQKSLQILRETRINAGPDIAQVDTLESHSMAEVLQEQSEANQSPALENVAVNPTESQSEERSVIHPRLPEEMTSAGNMDPELLGKWRKVNDFRNQSAHTNLGQAVQSRQSSVREEILSQPGSRKNSETQLWDVFEIFMPGTQERRVTWNQSQRSSTVPHPQHSFSSGREPVRVERPNTPHALLMSGYAQEANVASESAAGTYSVITEYVSLEPDVSQSAYLGVKSSRRSVRSDQSDQSEENQPRRDSCFSQSGEEESLMEVRRFSRKLKSPRLRRKRPINPEPDVCQMSQHQSADPGPASLPRNANSSSNSDSDSSHRRRWKQGPSSHRVLKMSSVKQNRGAFWNMDERNGTSADLHTFSDPEQPQRALNEKKPPKLTLKTQRSSSIPLLIFQGAQPKKHSRPPPSPSPPPGDFQLKDSPLQSLLERAKVREKERGGMKKGDQMKDKHAAQWEALPSSSHSGTPSPLPSDGDQEAEGDEVDLTGSLGAELFYGWREGNVDGSDDEGKSSPMQPEGASVDWPGWCFDDEEIINVLAPSADNFWGDLDKTLTFTDFSDKRTQEEGQYSEV